MLAVRGLIAFAIIAGVACQGGRSDINIEGTVTDSVTSDSLASANITLSYRTISFLDPGVILTKTDTNGHYKLHGRDVLCDGMSLGVAATGFKNSEQKTPRCEEQVQIMDFKMQP